jgi:hypothetical protein
VKHEVLPKASGESKVAKDSTKLKLPLIWPVGCHDVSSLSTEYGDTKLKKKQINYQ